MKCFNVCCRFYNPECLIIETCTTRKLFNKKIRIFNKKIRFSQNAGIRKAWREAKEIMKNEMH